MSAGDAVQRVKQQVQDGVAKAQREFDNAKSEAKRINERSQLPPAEDADQALQQVRDLRARMDRDIEALQSRVPPRETMMGQAKAVGGAVVGGLALVGTLAALRQKRQEKQEVEAEADRLARAIARHLPAALAEVSPPIRPRVVEDATEDGGGAGRALAIVALLASAAFAVWTQMRRSADDEDIWGPPATPPPPAAPTPAPGTGMPTDVPPVPPSAPGVSSTAPTSNEDDLFGNRPPAP